MTADVNPRSAVNSAAVASGDNSVSDSAWPGLQSEVYTMAGKSWSRFSMCVAAAGLLGTVTLLKHAANQFDESELVEGWPCGSAGEAKARGTLVEELTLLPSELPYKGHDLRFKEAWLEEASGLTHDFVWFSHYQPVGWRNLCFRVTDCYSLFAAPGGAIFTLEGEHVSFGMHFFPNGEILFHQRLPAGTEPPTRIRLLSSWQDDQSVEITVARKQ